MTSHSNRQKQNVIDYIGQTKFDAYLQVLKAKSIVLTIQEKFQLSDAEIVAIRAYSDIYYAEVNQYLRGSNPSIDHTAIPKLALFSETLSSALKKLPSVQGKMRRDINLSTETLDKFHDAIGKKVKFSSFTSTANSLRKVMDGHYNCRMEIESLKGKDISMFSVHGKKENEVIFDQSTIFVIKSIQQDRKRKSITVILLDESTEEIQ